MLHINASQQPAQRGKPWTPLDLGAKLAVWMDAEDSATMNLSGSLVNNWSNKAGNGLASQVTSSFKPTLNPAGLNGRPALVFDGTDDFLSAGGSFTVADSMGVNREVWGLVDQQAPDNDSIQRDLLRHGGSTTNRILVGRSSSGINRARASSGSGSGDVSTTNTTAVFAGVNVIRATADAAQVTVALNGGTTSMTAVASVFGPGNFFIGSRANTANFWWGAINSLLVTSPLTADEAARLMAFLKARGGLS